MTGDATFDAMAAAGAARLMLLADPPSGLRAIVALDNLAVGPALGGIRTRAYPDLAAAIADAQGLAAAMTLKCAIAGLPAGGAKTVVLDHPAMDRAAAFRRLGRFIEDLGGRYRAAGDLGTTAADLACAATATRYVATDGGALGAATGAGVVACMRALARQRGRAGLSGLTIAVQGCGVIGTGVAHAAAAEGATLILADVDTRAADALAATLGATVIAPHAIVTAAADIVAPCAVGGTITAEAATTMPAWGICGGANNQLADGSVAELLRARGIGFIPDFLASAGAVVVGAAREVMGGVDPLPLIAALGDTADDVIARSSAGEGTTVAVATAIARQRIAAAEAARA